MSRKVLSLLILGLFAMAATGCFSSSSSSDPDRPGGGDDNGNGEATAEVRAFHASPDAGNVDVYVNGDRVLEDVSFPAASPYLEVPAAELTVQIVPAGGDLADAVIEETVTPSEGGQFSFIVWGSVEAGNLATAVLDDGNDGVADGFVKIRPAHLAVGAPEVDLYVTAIDADLSEAQPVAAGLEFGDIADAYIEAPAEVSRLRVTVAGTTDVVYDYVADFPQFAGASLLAAALNTDQGFSPILIGAATGSDSLPFIPLIDQQAELRVVHGSPDAGPVDVEASIDGGDTWVTLVEGLEYFTQTGYVRVLGELDYDVRVLDADGNIAAELELSPGAGNAYSVFALGSVGAGNITFLAEGDLTAPVEEGQFALRAVHGIATGPTVNVEADGAAVIEDLEERTASGFGEFPAASYEVEVVTASGGDNVIGPLTVEFASTAVYTAVALPEDAEGNAGNTLWLIEDRISADD
ncbi:DUF4397 domain-containing protein [Natronospira bacteriovora]|uniref:DUF4397 domain-containing protein n=1 Tax=Natronospira bacteriovora TaxID=3069753 RepID=A0ABU0W5P0_9GAMM|nr:DUF4397 domain-containing protein [Natronospira sp. AB-CW4]MDQ2069342.1 DUF4397 domain-containing protein [Natronospira sp. AB-CW4]